MELKFRFMGDPMVGHAWCRPGPVDRTCFYSSPFRKPGEDSLEFTFLSVGVWWCVVVVDSIP